MSVSGVPSPLTPAQEPLIWLVELEPHHRPARAFSGAVGTSGLQVTTRPCLLKGYSLDTGVFTGTISLYNGQDATGQEVAAITYDNASKADPGIHIPPEGILCDLGLFQVNSAAITTAIFYLVLL